MKYKTDFEKGVISQVSCVCLFVVPHRSGCRISKSEAGRVINSMVGRALLLIACLIDYTLCAGETAQMTGISIGACGVCDSVRN